MGNVCRRSGDHRCEHPVSRLEHFVNCSGGNTGKEFGRKRDFDLMNLDKRALVSHFTSVLATTRSMSHSKKWIKWLFNSTCLYSWFGPPTRSRRDLECGIGSGGSQEKVGRVERAASSWEEAIRRARRPERVTRRAATGRTPTNRSTARRVTTSKVVGGRVSARTFCIFTSVNVRARVTSLRKAAFLWLDSMRVRARFEAQSLMGSPGKPAPEPRSARRTGESPVPTRAVDGKRCVAAKRDSPKWRVTISSGLRMAVRLMRAFQRRSISTYIDIS